jgi:hypothetical protein
MQCADRVSHPMNFADSAQLVGIFLEVTLKLDIF